MSDKLKNILTDTRCPSTEDFYAYLEKNLSKTENHSFESHLNECEFCQEALEGFEKTEKTFILSSTHTINQRVDERVKTTFSIQYITAAASIIIALFFGSLYLVQNPIESNELSVVKISNDEELNKDVLSPIENQQKSVAEEIMEPEEKLDLDSKNLTRKPEILIIANKDVIEGEEMAMVSEADMDIEESEQEVGVIEQMQSMSKSKIAENGSASSSMAGSIYDEKMKTASSVAEPSQVLELDKVDYKNEIPEINIKNLVAIANQKVSNQFITESNDVKERSKKTKTYDNKSVNNEISYINNSAELLKLIDELNNGLYQESLVKINTQQSETKWSSDEISTLKWLECISLLGLNQSAEQQLKALKKNGNPYQEEAKTLYNELY